MNTLIGRLVPVWLRMHGRYRNVKGLGMCMIEARQYKTHPLGPYGGREELSVCAVHRGADLNITFVDLCPYTVINLVRKDY